MFLHLELGLFLVLDPFPQAQPYIFLPHQHLAAVMCLTIGLPLLVAYTAVMLLLQLY